MWDGQIDPRRIRAQRGHRLIPPSPSIPISPSFPVSPAVPIPPPFHVSPPFQPSPLHPFSPPRHPSLRWSSSFPAPSPPSRHHPVILSSSGSPHSPSHSSLQPHFPVPPPRPTPAIQPSRHHYPSGTLTSTPGTRPFSTSPNYSLHPSVSLSPFPSEHGGVCVPQELHRRYEAAPESTKTKALQTVIEMKASTDGTLWSLWSFCLIL